MQVNGTVVSKSASCVLNSGDEVVFGLLGNHAYVSFLFAWRCFFYCSSNSYWEFLCACICFPINLSSLVFWILCLYSFLYFP